MSYDLFFKAKSIDTVPAPEDLAAYFSARRHFEVRGSQAWYSNETTGVYFSFEFGPETHVSDPDEDDAELAPDPRDVRLAFNLNYFRPHVFGLEAEPEVRSVVETFSLLVSDPQTHGMGDGEYSTGGFLRGWNAGNAFGYRAILSQEERPPVVTFPAARLEAVWRWNHGRDAAQEKLGDGIFVPRIFLFRYEGGVHTGVAWGDGCAIQLPEVDLVVMPRKALAPRRLFRQTEDMVVATFGQIAALVRTFPKTNGDINSYALAYGETPQGVAALVRSFRPGPNQPHGLATDQVLDEELVSEALRPGT